MVQVSKSPIMVYFFLLLSIFVLYFFTKNVYFDMKAKNWDIKILLSEIEEKNKEYEDLASLKQKIDANDIWDISFDKFLKPFNEEDFLVYFHKYVDERKNKMMINSINLTKWAKNDFWFNEWVIDLSMKFLDEKSMMDFLSFVIYNEDYNFYLDNFSYPLWKELKNFTINFNIKVLYK